LLAMELRKYLEDIRPNLMASPFFFNNPLN
jgi:hypothetical protein